MIVKLSGRIIRFDEYGKIYFMYGDETSRFQLERALGSMSGQKPYFHDAAEVNGFIAKPAKNILVSTSEGVLGPMSSRLMGMTLSLRVKPLNYKVGSKQGVRLQIVDMRENV